MLPTRRREHLRPPESKGQQLDHHTTNVAHRSGCPWVEVKGVWAGIQKKSVCLLTAKLAEAVCFLMDEMDLRSNREKMVEDSE